MSELSFEETFGSGASAAFNWRTGGSAWNVSRLGTAAAANTTPGTPPAYGTAFDLASASAITSEQFTDFARTMAQIAQRPLIDLASRNIPADQHARELEMAQNYEKYGLSMENKSFGDADAEGVTGWLSNAFAGARQLRNKVGQGFHEATEFIGINDDEAPSYETYVAKGGALTETEWNAFSPETRNELYDRANLSRTAAHVAGTPGLSHFLSAVDRGYKSAVTFTDIAARARRESFAGGLLPTRDSMSIWLDGSDWAASWRAANGEDPGFDNPLSLGNALVNNLISPKVSQDTLDEWRRGNPWYALGSVTTEFAATWHADLGVATLKGVGNLRRLARHEMPLKESGRMYAAIREAQQGREIISVQTPLAKRWAAYRAERTMEGFNGLIDYAKATQDDFRQFAQLPAFHGRAADGVAAAKAIHIAANSGDDNLIELTRGALNGDTRALRTIQEMKEDPSKAAKYVNGTNFVQAYDAVKFKATQLEEEILKLEKASADGTHSHFGRWEIDTDIALKQKEVSEMKAWLDADSDYKDWLDSIGTTSDKSTVAGAANVVDPFNPQLERYDAPKTKWNDATDRFELVTHRRFMPDIYSKHHTKIIVPPAIMARRVGVVAMHNLDSGARAVERTFDQYKSVLDFDDVHNLRAAYANRWATAPDNYTRYKAMYDMEEEVLPSALAGKLGISEYTARVVFNKINEERKRTFDGIAYGKGRMYDTAPTFAQRLQDETGATARMVKPADADGMVTLEFRDGQRLVTAEVPEGMLTPRVKPVDPTQTPNYYQPADVWRLYHEMKRHKDVLDEIDAGFFRRDFANLAEVNEILATKFYSFWKPLQLWRLGWPQRVLMDEGFRAMAIFGPMYWIAGPGAESVFTVAHNTPAVIRDKYRAFKHGRVVMTDGPLKPRTKAADAFAWQQEASKAVRLPAQHFPRVIPERFNRIEQVNIATGRAVTARNKFYALEREAGNEIDRLPGTAVDNHPLMRAIADTHDGTRVYDPVTGKRVAKGHFVPLPNLGHKIDTSWPYGENNLLNWYEQNAELLARRGIRIQVDGDEVRVGLWFNSKQRRRADEAMKAVARSKPVGEQTARGLNLNDGSDWELMELDTPDESTFLDEDMLASRVENDLARVEEGEIQSIADALGDFDIQINTIPPKKDFGTGRARFRAHGQDYYVDDVFEGHLGRLTRGLTSSAPAMDVLTDAKTAALGIMRHQSAGHVRIHAPKMTKETLKVGTPQNKKAVLYFQRWSDLLNNQVANSPVWGPMLKGARDEDIVKYLLEDPKGHKHRMEILEPHESVEMYVNEMRAKLDYYLPSHELRRRLAKGPIEPSDLRRKVHNDDLPDIYGPDLTLEDKGFLRALADTVWNALGTIPADKFSRQPFAKAIYNQKVRSLINQSDAKFLNEAALERIHVMAANHTREQIRQHLFDLTDGTNLTDALRFVAPFWGAQEEAILKWAKIISDRPETIARFMNGQRAIYNNMIVDRKSVV